jgi:DNA-binding MarR family transcriptional regulator
VTASSRGDAPTRAFVAIQRLADRQLSEVAGLLKPHGVSPTQYNVLRILRGAGTQGLICSEIGQRMITRDPDITRLLDRLEKRGMVARTREGKDRRAITVRITAAGLALLAELDEPVRRLHREQFRRLPAAQLAELIELLEETKP